MNILNSFSSFQNSLCVKINVNSLYVYDMKHIITNSIQMKPYKEIEHTADTALKIQGATVEQLFMNAVKGFYHLTAVPELNQSGKQKEIVLKESSIEELIISFLNELNYYLTVHFSVFSGFEYFKLVKEKKIWKLYAKGILTALEPKMISNLQEIKAVTYHQIQVEQKNGIYSMQIIFDI